MKQHAEIFVHRIYGFYRSKPLLIFAKNFSESESALLCTNNTAEVFNFGCVCYLKIIKVVFRFL